MPELDLTIDSIPIETKQRKLRVKWTKESEHERKSELRLAIWEIVLNLG